MRKPSLENINIVDRPLEFLIFFCVMCVGITIVIITFNALVDPFGIFNSPSIKGVNAVKPKMYNSSRMVRAHQIARVQPKGLILGTSRSELGLDPAHPGWSDHARPVYNSSLPSGRIYELYHYLLHAQSQGQLAQVILGLDFFSFDAKHPYEVGFIKERLDNGTKRVLNLNRVKDYVASLLSFNAISASIDTLRGQDLLKPGYLANGSLDTSQHPHLIKASGGHFGAFEKRLKSTLTSPTGIWALDYGQESGKNGEAMQWLNKLVSFCVSQKIELYMLISPVHAQWHELMFQLDIWDHYEQWKKDVTMITMAYKNKVQNSSGAELWDFSGFNAISMETVPKPDNSSGKMSWYWEASHYTRAVGNLMLDRVLIGIEGESPPGFGVKLTDDNIDQHLEHLREAHKYYLRSRPDEILYLKRLIRNSLGK